MSDRYNQKWVMLLAQPGAKNWAITLGQTTYYSCDKEEVDAAWRAHEEIHKQQWKKEGWRFAVNYLKSQLKHGYQKNPYEVAARGE